MSAFELFDLVALERDVKDKDLHAGDVGTVVELLNGPAVVVEFVEASGDTRAVMTVEESASAEGRDACCALGVP